jgi:hypothetical protein
MALQQKHVDLIKSIINEEIKKIDYKELGLDKAPSSWRIYENKRVKSTFKKLEDNKVPLTDEERKVVMDADATWHFSPGNKPSPAVWKSIDPKTKEVTYITHTHRAYNTAPTLKGAIGRYHKFIKGTA